MVLSQQPQTPSTALCFHSLPRDQEVKHMHEGDAQSQALTCL